MELAYNRKYRPKSLNEYIGDRVKNEIFSRFEDERNYPQSILLYGSKGCGKTSAARLIAKEYFCENKVNGHACGQCDMCKAIEEYIVTGTENYGAVKEIDIASDNKKDDIDEMLDDAMQRPMFPLQYKVLILDECHMATGQAQNRLLKILEEPPKWLVFIFCTTNPEKLLDTVRSRCQLKIEIRKPSREDLMKLLIHVCEKEGIKTSKQALDLIIKKGDRTPREVLSLLEEMAITCKKNIKYEDVVAKFDDIAKDVYVDFFRSANTSLEDIMKFDSKIRQKDIPFTKFLSGMMEFVLEALSIRYGIDIDNYSKEYVKAIKELFNEYTPDEMNFILSAVEYALKYSAGDDERARFYTVTLGMRINKSNIMTSLAMERGRVQKENVESVDNYSKMEKEENSKKDVNEIGSGDEALLDIFGSDVTNMSMQPKGLDSKEVDLGTDEDENESEEDSESKDDEYIKEIMKQLSL